MSHGQFAPPPPGALRRRQPCTPKPTLQFQVDDYPGKMAMRSMSQGQFVHPPPAAIRRRQPYVPKATMTFKDHDFPLPLSTHQTSFQQYHVPPKQLICPPKNQFQKDTLQDVPGTYNKLARTTSADAFMSKPIWTREPFLPPSSIASQYTSSEGWRFNQAGTTSATAYKSLVTPKMRESCRPSTNSSMSFFEAGETGRMNLSTSSAAFPEHDVRWSRRQSCKPTQSSTRPF